MSNSNENIKNNSAKNSHSSVHHSLSAKFSDQINKIFYGLGYLVALHPFKTILLSLLFTLICSSGCLRFHNEKNPLKLWIPQDSKFLHDTEWLMKSFQEGHRVQTVLITAPDVLQPRIFKKLAQISSEIKHFNAQYENGTSIGWTDICFQIPIIAELTVGSDRRKRSANDADDEFHFDDVAFNAAIDRNAIQNTSDKPIRKKSKRLFNPSVDLHPAIFCTIVEKLPMGCLLQNILELWNFNIDKIKDLTKEDILNALYKTNISSTTGHETDFRRLLGGVTLNASGHIVAASGLLSHWMVYVNFSNVNHDKVGNSAGTEDWASEEALIWENEYLSVLETLKEDLSDDETEIYYSAGRSYGDISSATMFQDMNKIIFGSILMFIFMQLVLSKFGWVELRVMLCSMGLLSVGMAFIASIGLCSFLGIPYGPVHTSLPFLLMGLGVDDMFVMMACWKKVQNEHRSPRDPKSMPERIGLMLQMAGSSITITSFTDIVAFGIGSITILPSLESFCLYAAMGVLITYINVTTFIVAIFTLDEHRILANRNAIIPCIAHRSSQTKLWCDAQLMNRAVKCIYSKFILTKPGKIIVLMTTVAVTAFSLGGLFRLEQRFDPNWFIPERTYLSKYITLKKNLYPDQGYEASIMMGKLNYSQELNDIAGMVQTIENRTDLVHEISSWISPFHEFVYTYFDKDFYLENLTEYEFRTYLSKFLHTNSGGKFQANFRFQQKLKCGEPVPDIMVSTIDFKYKRFNGRSNYIPAMHTIERIVDDTNLKSGDGFATVWGRIYGNWITDEVIDTEVLRNIILALVCVMVCTTILILNPQICFWIFTCVILTLINVCGLMESWGLTIDLVSCIGLELAVGLCVDYAAHVGHTFLVTGHGTRTERALETIMHIGPAVLYGGGSTLLAMSMLANSEAYTFQSFFKIFFLVIVFGLFFGLVYLPVILSIVGPSEWHTAKTDYKITPTHDARRTSTFNKNANDKNGTEMISFIHQDKNINNKLDTADTVSVSGKGLEKC